MAFIELDFKGTRKLINIENISSIEENKKSGACVIKMNHSDDTDKPVVHHAMETYEEIKKIVIGD